MSNDRARNRGSLFTNADKRKPSQPDMQGDWVIDGTPYDARAWNRDEELALQIAPPRGDRNTYPPDAFRGTLTLAPKGRKRDDGPSPTYVGVIEGDEGAYTVSAFEKQGKSGRYLTVSFEKLDRPARPATSAALPALDES
ncbi:MAG: hypothetical protein AB7S26_18590 [Sandaracinaceae bacterium]